MMIDKNGNYLATRITHSGALTFLIVYLKSRFLKIKKWRVSRPHSQIYNDAVKKQKSKRFL